MEIVLPIIYTFWFLAAFVYIFKPHLFGKLRMPLHRYGFLANWSVYVPNEKRINITYSLMYRDKNKEEELSEWIKFSTQKWSPFIFIFNLHGRLNSVTSKCVRVLTRSTLNQEELKNEQRFLYLCAIICSFNPKLIGASRQVQLILHSAEGIDTLIVQSDFTLLK
jgi:hypothetical protein